MFSNERSHASSRLTIRTKDRSKLQTNVQSNKFEFRARQMSTNQIVAVWRAFVGCTAASQRFPSSLWNKRTWFVNKVPHWALSSSVWKDRIFCKGYQHHKEKLYSDFEPCTVPAEYREFWNNLASGEKILEFFILKLEMTASNGYFENEWAILASFP